MSPDKNAKSACSGVMQKWRGGLIVEDNRLIFEEYVKGISDRYGEQIFFAAVETLRQKECLIERQYPFLDDVSMRERNFAVLKSILNMCGYDKSDDLILSSFEVPFEGWMHCIYFLGGRFSTPREVKEEVVRHFSRQQCMRS